MDGKNNGTAWYPTTFPTTLEIEFEKPVKVNTAEVALDWFYENYYDITDMDIEYLDGEEWVPIVEGASLGEISKVFTFDEFESNKVRLKINKAWKYAYYGYIGVDAFRLFYLNDEVTTDKGALDRVIAVAQKCVENGEVDAVIDSVKDSFNHVFNYAKDVSDNIQSSQETIDNTTVALIEEIRSLAL